MEHRQTLLLEMAYDGAAFHGVAPQPGFPTVSGTLERHLTSVFGVRPKALTFAARTDRGVSALQNFATCWFRGVAATPERMSQLTARLPGLHVRDGVWVPRQVNARNSTREKHYRYIIRADQTRDQVARGHVADAWLMVPSLDLSQMQRAARLLVGTHDFSAFRAAGCEGSDPVKTLVAVEVGRHGTDLTIDVVGRAFLRKMVRILVGTLAEVGAHLRSPESVLAALEARNRGAAGLTAPAHGLCLVSVQLAGVPTRCSAPVALPSG